MSILEEKEYPHAYPREAVRVLNAMTFTNGVGLKIMGSASLKSQSYAGDYDGYEIVDMAPEIIVSRFKDIIKKLKNIPNTYIGDIKAGLVEEWRVLPKNAKNLRGHTEKVETLFEKHIISSSEYKTFKELLSKEPTKVNILKALQEIKPHIVRWTPKQIMEGKQTLADGRTYTLLEAIQSPTITKLDAISLIKEKYTEFSVIYEFHYKGQILNPDVIDPEKSLQDSLLLYESENNRFKALKRKFAIAKLHNNLGDLEKYNKLLNSDLGKLYVVYSDVQTLGDLLGDADLPSAKVTQAIKDFRFRLSHIYGLEHFLRAQKELLGELNEAVGAHTQSQKASILLRVAGRLLKYLTKETKLRGGFSYLE